MISMVSGCSLQQKLNGIPDFLIWRGNHVGTVASLVGLARLRSIARYSVGTLFIRASRHDGFVMAY
jgi:hypothetical protein